MVHDFSFNSGERQVAAAYADIRADHRYRYEWAADLIPAGGFGLDVFCGNGYGTWLLGERNILLSIDGSSEAIAFANQHFKRDTVMFSVGVYPFVLPAGRFDFIVSLESVEHVEDGLGFMKSLADALRPGGLLIFSTPCEDRVPHRFAGNQFHYRHYTLAETLAMPGDLGLHIVKWAGQDCYVMQEGHVNGLIEPSLMTVNEGKIGQFIVVAAQKPLI